MNTRTIKSLYEKIYGEKPATQTVSIREAVELMRNLGENQKVRLLTSVEPREVKRTGNPYAGNLVRISLREARIKIDYEIAVNEQRVAEDKPPTFRAEPRKWGEHVNDTIIEHTNKQLITNRYIAVEVIDEIYSAYYTRADVEVPREQLERFISHRPHTSRQEVDEPVKYRNYMLSSILGFSILDDQDRETSSFVINHNI